jgi:hypothetical protein
LNPGHYKGKPAAFVRGLSHAIGDWVAYHLWRQYGHGVRGCSEKRKMLGRQLCQSFVKDERLEGAIMATAETAVAMSVGRPVAVFGNPSSSSSNSSTSEGT